HVVTVTNECNLQSLQIVLRLPNGEIVRHRLAGMTEVGEPVDNWNAGEPRHLLHHYMREGANHDALHHAFQVLSHVVNRLALAQIDLSRREVQRESAQLLNAHIKSYPRA